MSRMKTYMESNNSDSLSGRATQCIQDHPDESVLVALAAGTVVGLAIGGMLADSGNSRGWRDRHIARGLGERLMSSLDNVLPNSVSSSLGLDR